MLVGVVMGSASDWDVMKAAAEQLKSFGVPYEARALSAHRTPEALERWIAEMEGKGAACFIAAAGGAAHLAGVVAAKTRLPVLGVPIPSKHLQGLDSLLSMVQMPKGIPVATFAIGEAGAANAALFAVAMLALAGCAARRQARRVPQEAGGRGARNEAPGVTMADGALFESSIKSLPFLHRGKVRDLYAVGDDKLLVIQSDRLSAFDVVLPSPVPGKGKVLTALSLFWFEKLAHVIPNHLTGVDPDSVVAPGERDQVAGRAMVVRRLKPLPIEAIARGYIIGSGWKDYQKTGAICGITLPAGLREAEQLPQPIFTPSTKAAIGKHDENIPFEEAVKLLGPERANAVREATLRLYTEGAAYARSRGIIMADTKFEFGADAAGKLYLIDEALTPDSSRFWPADQYRVGMSPPSFDKQFVRDWLEAQKWNKQPPAPELPADVLAKTAEKYREALRLLTGKA